MAKIVIAGKADCPYFAKAELLGDQLTRNLPDFKLHKVVKNPDEWEKWLKHTCNDRGWQHRKSPIIWRELIDRGGKGVLIGSCNEFLEYATGYYGMTSPLQSDDLRKVAGENLQWKEEADLEARQLQALSNPMKVCVTAGSREEAYLLLHSIVSGQVFGANTEIALHLVDCTDTEDALTGVAREVEDLSCGPLRSVTTHADFKAAFTDCSVVVLLEDTRQQEEEEWGDWMKRNAQLATCQMEALEQAAAHNVKVLVAGAGPVNFRALVMQEKCQRLLRQNIVGLSRVAENQVKSVLGERLKVNPAFVVDCVLWGNASGANYVDVTRSRVHNFDGAVWGPPFFSRDAREMVHDDKWLEAELLELVEKRQATAQEMVGSRRLAMARAGATASLLDHWWNGSPHGQIFSLAVRSEGWYGVPEGLVFSLPVTFSPKGNWVVVEDLELTAVASAKLQHCVKDVQKERWVLYPNEKAPTPEPEPDVKTPSDSGDTTAAESAPAEGDESSLARPSLERITEDPVAEAQAAETPQPPPAVVEGGEGKQTPAAAEDETAAAAPPAPEPDQQQQNP